MARSLPKVASHSSSGMPAACGGGVKVGAALDGGPKGSRISKSGTELGTPLASLPGRVASFRADLACSKAWVGRRRAVVKARRER